MTELSRSSCTFNGNKPLFAVIFFFNKSLHLKQFCSVQTRKTASWLAAELSKEGHQVALLSGEMMVEQRAAVIERFREGKEKVLVTTNVCARGEQRTCLSARPRVAREACRGRSACLGGVHVGLVLSWRDWIPPAPENCHRSQRRRCAGRTWSSSSLAQDGVCSLWGPHRGFSCVF